ncbi:hypothetical protein BUALT_Bualt03G0160200 [Buddleja alternifolia]|uniref:MYB-CC type transcription factor LHEQLE-containing domain-containing protein n=1 Tax=Buddleja alternifolia TaxID=168488 RepID=A0AAV6Y2M6_9LAMI|nr:hypothetical protein BUALT_Bualt03G0160200 [Buddleja alternifolia]
MFHPKKPSSMNSHERPMCVQGDSGLVLTTDPKPRLRWTVELHERFVDAVTQLGGPDSMYTYISIYIYIFYKFRLGKQPHKDFNDHSMKDASSLELQRNNASSSGMMGRSMNDGSNIHNITDAIRMQMEVQRHLQLRIEAQGKYMQTILEKACQTLAGENMASGSYNKAVGPDISGMKDFGPSMNFPSLQDLNIYGGTDQLEELHHHNMERSSSLEGFMQSTTDHNFLTKKRPNPYTNNSGKSPLIWADDLRLQELGTAATASSCLDDHQIQIGPLSIDRGSDIDSVSDIYETKPMLSGDHSVGDNKKFDAPAKLERPSPRRTVERMNHAAISAGGMVQGRSSPFG